MAKPEKKAEEKPKVGKSSEEKKKTEKKEEVRQSQQIRAENVVRILSADIPSTDNIYSGLTKIKGVSWSFSNALCNSLNLDKKRKFSSLSESEIEKITDFVKSPKAPDFILNRRKDKMTGKCLHLITSDLDFRRDMDIRNEKKIRSLKGWRHALGQPVRGQKTRSHFRKGKAIGVQKRKSAPAKAEGRKK